MLVHVMAPDTEDNCPGYNNELVLHLELDLDVDAGGELEAHERDPTLPPPPRL